jgi:Cu-Zn family superoxide dismutase
MVIALFAVISAQTAGAAERATANLTNAAGDAIGIAFFEQTPVGVVILLEVGGLPPGWHAVHLHGVGACTPDFLAAGGHINPARVSHGIQNPQGPDNGDLPNIFVGRNGRAVAEMFTTWVSVLSGRVPLLDRDGSALIVHEHGDDHASQPIGGAGGRIACGVVMPH